MAKYIVKTDIFGAGGAVTRKAGTSVEIKDESNVDQALFYRAVEQESEKDAEKTLEVATPKRKPLAD